MQQQPVHGKIKLQGRRTRRPYDLTGIGIYDFVRNFRKAVGCGNGDAAPRVHGKIKLHGRPAGRPYVQWEIRRFAGEVAPAVF